MKIANKKIISFLLLIFVFFNILSMRASTVYATQSKYENFSKNYTLTGNCANDIVAIASAQIGKTKAQLGYTEAWCADFVTDCARLTNVSDSIIPYNYASRGACTYLYNKMVNSCASKPVSNRKAGDFVFYYCSSCGRYVHVGIVADETYSIEGNYGGKVTKVSNSYTDSSNHTLKSGTVKRVYLRPNWDQSPNPSIIIDNAFPKNIKSYTISDGHVTTYSSVGGASVGWIDGSADLCTINEVYTNGWIKVTYPTSNRNKTAYCYLSDFINSGVNHYNTKVSQNTNVYKKSNLASSIGTAYSTDNLIVVGESGDKLQIIYPISNGYKMGWIKKSSVTKPFRMDVDTPNNSIIDCDGYAINGWAIDESGVNRVTCSINDGAEFDAERYERTDVSNAFSGYPTGREGFTARLPIRSMKNGDNKVVIRVYCGNGVVKDWGMNVKFNDSESPVILDTRITECSDEEFVFSCWFKDNFAVSNVRIAVWSDEKGGQDDLIWYDGNIEGNKTSIRVNIKDHNYEYGPYWIHAYVYDVAGNYSVGTGPLNGLYLDKSPVEVVNKNGNIYAAFRKPLKWHEAKEICEQMGGHLMTITESWEQDIAKDFSNKYGSNLYIGATDEEEEGNWKWVTGENFDYTQWAVGEPNNDGNGEDYLGLFQNGLWNDFSDNYFRYILEIDSALPILGKKVFGNKEYLCYDYSMAWEVAKEYCKNKGGNLAIIDSKEKNDVISELIKDGTKDAYFLGASDKENEGNWNWINGENINYANWGNTQPDNYKNSEDYLEISKRDGKWNDLYSMDSGRGFICERTINSIDITPPSKTTYNVGESLDLSGMKVVANYDNGVSEEIEDYNISGYTSTGGEKTITVSYGEKTATFNVIVKANPVIISNFTTNKTSPQYAGTAITLTANATGTGTLQYRFRIGDEFGNYTTIKDYSTSNTVIWNANYVGNKILCVDVKDENRQVTTKTMSYVINEKPVAPTISSFIANKTSPQVSGTKVTLTAKATGTGTLKYKFLIQDSNGNWGMLRDYGTSNTYTWTTGAIGTKTLYVDVKDSNGKVTRKSMSYTVKEEAKAPIISSFTASKQSPQVSGNQVTLTAKATGSGTLQYKFLIQDSNGIWGMLRDYGTSNSIVWKTGKTGTKTLYVDVKDSNGKVTRKGISYTVKN
ncbi:MAG: GBS Bsp-like repeat-containing protein, partial [Clostridium sp.]|nr:GBS Bsp-like repeat-containing protein [Clostridium sp.]